MENPILDNTIANNSGSTCSLWMDVEQPAFLPLKKDLSTDICIVGGGIVGLTCAYHLAKQGKSVVLIDQGAIGGGQTARTSAHLTWVLDERYSQLETFFGKNGITLAAQSHAAAIDAIEKIISEEHIACDFERVDGYLFAATKDQIKILDQEFLTLQKINMPVNKIARAPCNPSFDTGPCLQFPQQAQFHVLKYLQGLLQAVLKLGVKIYSHTHADHFEDGIPCIVKTAQGATIQSQSLIIATCTPVNNRFFIHTKQAAYRSYVIAAKIPKNSVSKGLYWDTLDPYHYIRVQKNLTDPHLDWLIIGGEDHKVGQKDDSEKRYDTLEKWAKERFPMIDTIDYCWSGQVFNPVDTLAFIGRNPGDKNIYIATGDCGNGLTHGTIAGILIPDLIAGIDTPWKEIYEPSRKTIFAATKFIEENFNSVSQYKDWFTPDEKKQVEQLIPEEGILLREGIKKIAVYKDTKGNIHIHSAFCTHLGGCLQWNHGEKSWDCPVHGARFDGCGSVLNGPALNPLQPEKESKELAKDLSSHQSL